MRNRFAVLGVYKAMISFHGGDMGAVRQSSRLHAAPLNVPEARAEQLVHHGQQPVEEPGAELADLYAAILVAVPLAFAVLKWLWP